MASGSQKPRIANLQKSRYQCLRLDAAGTTTTPYKSKNHKTSTAAKYIQQRKLTVSDFSYQEETTRWHAGGQERRAGTVFGFKVYNKTPKPITLVVKATSNLLQSLRGRGTVFWRQCSRHRGKPTSPCGLPSSRNPVLGSTNRYGHVGTTRPPSQDGRLQVHPEVCTSSR